MKINFTLFFIPLMLVSGHLFCQVHHEWSFGIGSKESEGQGAAFADYAGNIYSLMQMKDSVDVDPGPGVELIVPEKDLCLVLTKNDENGNLVYGFPFDVDAGAYGEIMEVAQNQIRISIGFRDSLVYTHNHIREMLFNSPGSHQAILSLDLDGKLIRHYVFSASEDLYFSSMHTLPDGKIVMAGTFNDSFALSTQTPWKLYSDGGADGFILLADQNFNTYWAYQFKGTGYDYIASMVVENDERIYFTAGFDDSLSLATLQGPILQVSLGDNDALFGYLNLKGEMEKVFFIRGTGYDDISDIASDALGNMYICGEFENTVNFAGTSQAPRTATAVNESDGYVAKYDATGNLVWLGLYPSEDYGGAYTLDLKRGNELYISGTFTLKSDLNPGPDSLIVYTGYHSSPFISKLSTDGEFIWAVPFITNEVAGIRALMVLTASSRIVANGFYYDSLHCSEIPGENWLHTDHGADCFLFSLTEENVVTANHEIPGPITPSDISVFPNPTSANITVKSESAIKSVSIQSADGRLIRTIQPALNETEIKMSDLPTGIYYLSVRTNDKVETEKVIKE